MLSVPIWRSTNALLSRGCDIDTPTHAGARSDIASACGPEARWRHGKHFEATSRGEWPHSLTARRRRGRKGEMTVRVMARGVSLPSRPHPCAGMVPSNAGSPARASVQTSTGSARRSESEVRPRARVRSHRGRVQRGAGGSRWRRGRGRGPIRCQADGRARVLSANPHVPIPQGALAAGHRCRSCRCRGDQHHVPSVVKGSGAGLCCGARLQPSVGPRRVSVPGPAACLPGPRWLGAAGDHCCRGSGLVGGGGARLGGRAAGPRAPRAMARRGARRLRDGRGRSGAHRVDGRADHVGGHVEPVPRRLGGGPSAQGPGAALPGARRGHGDEVTRLSLRG